MRIRVMLLLCLAMTATTLHARKPETGFLNRTIKAGGAEYRYVVYVPKEWNKGMRWPVILFLHGAGERGDDGLKQSQVGLGGALRMHAERWPFIVVMPQCGENKTWTDPAMQQQ